MVPLADSAVDILRGLPRIAGSGLVFTLNGRRHITAFSLTEDRLDARMPDGVPHWTLHDFRRTFASGCARLGIAVHVVEAALNHRSGTIRGVTAIYNRYSYDDRSARIDRAMNLNERVEQLLDAGPEHGVGSAQYLAAITKLVHPLFARRAMRACAAYLDSVLLARPAPNLRKEYKATGISMAQVQALSRLSPKAKRYAKVAPEVIDALAVVAAMGVGGALVHACRRGQACKTFRKAADPRTR